MSTMRRQVLLARLAQFPVHSRGRPGDLRRPQGRAHRGRKLMAEAYKIIDHLYDVVVVGAGGSGPARDHGRGREGASRPPASPRCSDPQPHRSPRRAASPPARATTRPITGPGTCTTPSRVGLARRPGRDRIYGPRGARPRLRARTLWRAVQPQH
jgi:hypothetical protein